MRGEPIYFSYNKIILIDPPFRSHEPLESWIKLKLHQINISWPQIIHPHRNLTVQPPRKTDKQPSYEN